MLLAISIAWSPATAEAQQGCVPFDQISQQLADQYGETPHQIGVSTFGHILLLFTNNETGTWTIIARRPNNLGCMMDAGDRFGGIAPPPDTPAGTRAGFTPIHEWYTGLSRQSPDSGSISCCGSRDCAPYEYRRTEGGLHYEAHMPDGSWLPIPAETILPMSPLTEPERIHVCCYGGHCQNKHSDIRCAIVPGFGA